LATGLDLGGVLDFGLVLPAGFVLRAGLLLAAGLVLAFLDLAFRGGALVRLTVPALDLLFVLLLVFALLLAFAAAFAFADFVFFLATMRASPAPNDSQPSHVATPTTKPQGRLAYRSI
jgi:hypothetical protein